MKFFDTLKTAARQFVKATGAGQGLINTLKSIKNPQPPKVGQTRLSQLVGTLRGTSEQPIRSRLSSLINVLRGERKPSTQGTIPRTLKTIQDPHGTQERQNKLFQKQINLAGQKKTNTLDDAWLDRKSALTYQNLQVKIFYASTKNVWRNVSPDMRNQAIMDYYGTDSLEAAFNLVMDNNTEALDAARRYAKNNPVDTVDNEFDQEKGDDDNRQDTGILEVTVYINYV